MNPCAQTGTQTNSKRFHRRSATLHIVVFSCVCSIHMQHKLDSKARHTYLPSRYQVCHDVRYSVILRFLAPLSSSRTTTQRVKVSIVTKRTHKFALANVYKSALLIASRSIATIHRSFSRVNDIGLDCNLMAIR